MIYRVGYKAYRVIRPIGLITNPVNHFMYSVGWL